MKEDEIEKLAQYTVSLILGIILLILTSCSAEDDCVCEKETFKQEYDIVFIGGLPKTIVIKNTISKEIVPCQDEQKNISLGNDIFFNVNCY